MKGARDIYTVSLPLVVGTMAASLLFAHVNTPISQHITASSLFIAACACYTYAALIPGDRVTVRSHIFWCGAFFILGASCFATRHLLSWAEDISFTVNSSSWQKAGQSINEIIDAVPFTDRENNGLLKALILGDRSGLNRATTAYFRAAGASHLLALSGMHLGIIYIMVSKALFFLGNSIFARKIRSGAIILITGYYALMCGAGPSLVRAWLFIMVREIAIILERPQDPRDVFCSALTLHLIFRPQSITELGFQLSYSAMIGIVFLWPAMKTWYEGNSIGAKIWQGASLSICAQAFTAPLTLYHFATFPKYFLITNLFAAPLMTIVMICGILAIILSATGLSCDSSGWMLYALELPFTALRSLLSIIAKL